MNLIRALIYLNTAGQGSGGLIPAVGDGTVGIFGSVSTFNQYTFGTDAVVRVPATSQFGTHLGCAAGNSTQALFLSGESDNVQKYAFSDSVFSEGTNLTQGVNVDTWMGTGISSLAIFALGNSTSTLTNKYVYAGDIVSVATSLVNSSVFGSAVGNSTEAIFAIGEGRQTTNKYFYADDTVSVGINLTADIELGGAVGNATFGVFALGGNGTASRLTSTYVYSGDIVAAGALLFVAAGGGLSCAGNSVLGIIGGGGGQSNSKYLYSSNSVTSANESAFSGPAGAGASNGNSGVIN